MGSLRSMLHRQYTRNSEEFGEGLVARGCDGFAEDLVVWQWLAPQMIVDVLLRVALHVVTLVTLTALYLYLHPSLPQLLPLVGLALGDGLPLLIPLLLDLLFVVPHVDIEAGVATPNVHLPQLAVPHIATAKRQHLLVSVYGYGLVVRRAIHHPQHADLGVLALVMPGVVVVLGLEVALHPLLVQQAPTAVQNQLTACPHGSCTCCWRWLVGFVALVGG
mmetsp:Transcript_34582/g.99571  ORF Transcript_34582/g.99571 Transcript_34582/m.99571 type:complete len:219 (-) Transcript_34582:522-1178(-)